MFARRTFLRKLLGLIGGAEFGNARATNTVLSKGATTNLKIIEQKNENIQIEPKIDNQKQEEVKEVENSLEKFTQNIKKYLLEVQKGEDKSALFLLLMASFIYGVIHSIGPGHGKALAFSYFSSSLLN